MIKSTKEQSHMEKDQLLTIAMQSSVREPQSKTWRQNVHPFSMMPLLMTTPRPRFVNSFMYYGLSFNTNDFAGNPYLNLFVAGALEFPSYAFLFWSINKWGRRFTLVLLMMVGGGACTFIVAVPSGEHFKNISSQMCPAICVGQKGNGVGYIGQR
ncbi:hypothetical protein TNCV_1727991 [Trichonephila clavipes]|nr:hypothetical protein TNCV_1727991 [Trichonephila clavipes]